MKGGILWGLTPVNEKRTMLLTPWEFICTLYNLDISILRLIV